MCEFTVKTVNSAIKKFALGLRLWSMISDGRQVRPPGRGRGQTLVQTALE